MESNNTSSPSVNKDNPSPNCTKSKQDSTLVVDLSRYNHQSQPNPNPNKKNYLEGLSIDEKGDVYLKNSKNPIKLTLSQKLILLQSSEKADEYEDLPLGEAIRKEVMRILGSREFAYKYGKHHYSQEELDEYMKNEIFQRTIMKKHGEDIKKQLLTTKNTQDTVILGLHAPEKVTTQAVKEGTSNAGLKSLLPSSSNSSSPYAALSWAQEEEESTPSTTILSAIKSTVDPTTNVIFDENPNPNSIKSGEYSYAIIVVGETPYAETFGDSLNLTISEPGPSILKNVCKYIKCVVVLITGRPVVFQPYIADVDALVAAWLPGTEGQGVTDVLFGDYGFSGKLARTWFKNVDQLPMNVGDKYYDPLFPFGFGLTTSPSKTI